MVDTRDSVGENLFRSGVWCAELDLSDDALRAGVTNNPAHASARVLVRLHGATLGYLTFSLDREVPSVASIRRAALSRWSTEILDHLARERQVAEVEEYLRRNDPLPRSVPGCPARVDTDHLVSVVICTHNRPQLIARCLAGATALAYRNLEILVVDNAPSDDATQAVVAEMSARDSRVRYVVEPRKGLSKARNTGLLHAKGRIIAYTDDDVEIDAKWLEGLVNGFERDPDIRCTTGLVCSADVSNEYQAYFDAKTALWSTRTTPALFGPTRSDHGSSLYPYDAGVFGTGANMAFDRSTLLELGGFDEALGAGTHTRGGEDLDMFVRVILAGYSIAYEPHAVVWHHHRSTSASSAAQMLGYGSGLTAYMMKLMCAKRTRMEVLRRVVPGAGRLVKVNRSGRQVTGPPTDTPRGLGSRERLGYLYGPIAYVRSRINLRQRTRDGIQR